MTINNRVQNVIDSLYSSNKRAFSQAVGVSPTVIDGIVGRRQSQPSFSVLQKIYANANISAEWLLGGTGSMIKEKQNMPSCNLEYEYSPKLQTKIDNQLIPLLDIDASAGLSLLFCTDRENIIDYLQIPNLSKVDGAMFITGDSMYPLLKSGDIVIFKQIHEFQYILYGEIYILSYNIGGDDYVVIKYINKGDAPDHVKLVSYNTHHSPVEIPVEAIRAMALVKASVRYNTMM